MKKYIILLVISFISKVSFSQAPPPGPRLYLTSEIGALTFSKTPILGLLGVELEAVDDKVPLVINFRNSLWLTSSNTKIFMWELSAGRRILNKDNKFKYTDIGGTFGFMGYYPKTNLVAPVGLYCTVHANNKLSFRTELLGDLSEFLSKESTGNKFGISVMFSYKLDYFKLKY